MGWIRIEAGKDSHDCSKPGKFSRWRAQAGYGSVWKCNRCLQLWMWELKGPIQGNYWRGWKKVSPDEAFAHPPRKRPEGPGL